MLTIPPPKSVELPLPPPSPAVKQPKLVRYSQHTKRPTQWLWPQRIAMGRLTLLVGEPGLGKGSVAADLAARVSRGSAWPDQPQASAPLGTTIVVCAEHERDELVPERLAAAGADLDRICTIEPDAIEDGSAFPWSMGYQLAALQAALESTPDCKLVVIDPLVLFLENAESRKDGTMYQLLRALTGLARKYRVAIVAVAHLNLRASVQSVDRMNHALRTGCGANKVWAIVRDRSDGSQRLMLSLDVNFAEEQAGLSFRLSKQDGEPRPQVAWGAAATTSLEKMLSHSRFNGAEQTYRDRENFVTTQLREVLSSGPVERSSLQLTIRGSDDQLYRAADRLEVVKEKSDFYGGWVWMLPEHRAAWQAGQAERKQQQAIERRERKTERQRMSRAERRQARRAERLRSPSAEDDQAPLAEEPATAGDDQISQEGAEVAEKTEQIQSSFAASAGSCSKSSPTESDSAEVQDRGQRFDGFWAAKSATGRRNAETDKMLERLRQQEEEFERDVAQAEARSREERDEDDDERDFFEEGWPGGWDARGNDA